MQASFNTTLNRSVVLPTYQRSGQVDRIGFHINEGNESGQKRKTVEKADESLLQNHKKRAENQQTSFKNSPEKFKEQLASLLQGRTLLFQMMESMGATGTEYSATGQYLDTYI